MSDIENNKQIQKLIRYSAYIAILNRLKKDYIVSEDEYEQIKNKIKKPSI